MRLGRRLGRVLRIYDPTEMLLRRDEAVSSPLRFTAFHHDLVVWRGTVTVLAYPKAHRKQEQMSLIIAVEAREKAFHIVCT